MLIPDHPPIMHVDQYGCFAQRTDRDSFTDFNLSLKKRDFDSAVAIELFYKWRFCIKIFRSEEKDAGGETRGVDRFERMLDDLIMAGKHCQLVAEKFYSKEDRGCFLSLIEATMEPLIYSRDYYYSFEPTNKKAHETLGKIFAGN